MKRLVSLLILAALVSGCTITPRVPQGQERRTGTGINAGEGEPSHPSCESLITLISIALYDALYYYEEYQSTEGQKELLKARHYASVADKACTDTDFDPPYCDVLIVELFKGLRAATDNRAKNIIGLTNQLTDLTKSISVHCAS